MTEDLSELLDEWQPTPGEITARKVLGRDGRPKLQMRLEMGLLQMEWDGRPDGSRPKGYESMLDYLERQARVHELTHAPTEPYVLDADACRALEQEGIQYYYRYLCLLHLGEYAEAERDTERNLRMFDFVSKYAADRETAWAFEQYRPYVVLMNTRARASICLETNNTEGAVAQIRQGIARLEQFLVAHPDLDEDECEELAYLRAWEAELRQLGNLLPSFELSEESRLELALEEAVAVENYEQAAELRDALKGLRES